MRFEWGEMSFTQYHRTDAATDFARQRIFKASLSDRFVTFWLDWWYLTDCPCNKTYQWEFPEFEVMLQTLSEVINYQYSTEIDSPTQTTLSCWLKYNFCLVDKVCIEHKLFQIRWIKLIWQKIFIWHAKLKHWICIRKGNSKPWCRKAFILYFAIK